MKMILILWLLIIAAANAETFYVDNINGNDSLSGLNEETAWKTIRRVNSQILLPGDVVLFKRDGVWREQLNLFSSGMKEAPIEIDSYGNGNDPVISGAVVLKDFNQYTMDFIWQISIGSKPEQLFLNNVRGSKKDFITALLKNGDWFFNEKENILYLYLDINPSSFLIEAAVNNHAISIKGKHIVVNNLQVEKTTRSTIKVWAEAEDILLNNLTLYQWTDYHQGDNAGIIVFGSHVQISNCTFGKNTGSDIEDQNWAGFESIKIKGRDIILNNNKIYHSAIENESGVAHFANGINVESIRGVIRIHDNFIYHTGSHGIKVNGYSVKGDSIFIYNNTVQYPGQAGISAYKTRGDDGTGAVGFVYRNHVSFANRLGGDTGANGSESSGIHMNNGVREFTEPNKPYIKWFVYENVVHDSQAHADSTSEDSGGINADYNANGVEIFRNMVFNNWGKGITLWNSNNCKVYYNIVYGNDAGTILTSANYTIESSSNHEVYNNTYYKNFNGFDKGPNYHTEIYFGKGGHNNKIMNNILYASDNGFAYYYDTMNTSGIIVDYNILYKDNGDSLIYDKIHKKQTFEMWRLNHPHWDINSAAKNPELSIIGGKFYLTESSPAIDNGILIDQEADFWNNEIVGPPDIGAVEFTGTTNITDKNFPGEFILYQNFPNPFNHQTTIRFKINPADKGSERTTLIIYDILGNRVKILIEDNLTSGTYEVQFDITETDAQASGIYFYTLRRGNSSLTKKLIFLK